MRSLVLTSDDPPGLVYNTILNLLVLDRTTRSILTNTPTLWTTVMSSSPNFGGLCLLTSLSPHCFDTITELIVTDTEDSIHSAKALTSLLFKCRNLKVLETISSEPVCIQTLLQSIKARLVETPLSLPHLEYVHLDFPNAKKHFSKIRKLQAILATSSSKTVDMKPLPCTCNKDFRVLYQSRFDEDTFDKSYSSVYALEVVATRIFVRNVLGQGGVEGVDSG
ncbi:hypothetical protein HDU79_004276 [Rhizoclosmatium sp. JEL0117]|nr:hypothetical protein HDU79_004276 [Rhizoclosmatium sp. JEL0117]